jgi:hypothetical protein
MLRWPLLIFLAVFLVHSLSPMPLSADSRWTVPVAGILLGEGKTNMDEYLSAIKEENYDGVECVHGGEEVVGKVMGDCAGGHLYNLYPVGGPLIAAPFVFVLHHILLLAHPILAPLAEKPGVPPLVAGFLSADLIKGHAIMESIIASFLVAITSVILYFLALPDLRPKWAAGIAFVFAFATSAWSTGSRAMFSHTPSMLLLVLTMYFLTKPRLVFWAGLTSSFAYVVRPTNGLVFAAVAAYVLWRERSRFLPFCACALPVLGCFAVYNLAHFEHLVPTYYRITPPFPDVRFLKALAGNLISPGRGLFVYSPVLLFSLGGMVRAWKTRWQWPLSLLWFVLIVSHWLAISLFVGFWWGGHSYGPRLFLDVVPLCVLFLIPLFKVWQTGAAPARTAFLVAALVSVAIHGRGATSLAPHRWNIVPDNVDRHQERLWDWTDPAFLR